MRAKSLLDHVRDGTFRPPMHTAVLAREALPVKPPHSNPTPAMNRLWSRQTETLVIRGMALGVYVRTVFARELVTGLVVGVLLGSAFFAFALGIWGDARVAAAVGISLAISCSVASLVAMALPYGLARLGRDPAFGSGPLATVIQDLLSIVAYFAVALLIVS